MDCYSGWPSLIQHNNELWIEVPVNTDKPGVDSYDRESIIADIECLMARIESLQDHASAHQCLREAQLELIEKRELLASI